MRTKPSTILLSAVLLAATLSWHGCANQTLDPSGPYGGDMVMYQADSAIVDLADLFDEVEALAIRNPGPFASDPNLVELLARVRKEQDGVWEPDEVLGQLILAQQIYKRSPNDSTLSGLQNRIRVARFVLLETRALVLPYLIP